MQLKVEEKVKRSIYVAPCIKCGSDDIQISDYGYNAPNIGGGQCKKCGHDITANCDIFPKADTLVCIWNAQNCKETLIKKKQDQIEKIQSEITELQKC